MDGTPSKSSIVTIGMPTNNSAWSLPQVLESILAFDFDLRRIRLVFVDNFSKDNTVPILKEFLSKHGQKFGSFVIETAHANIPEARNICFERAEGTDYVFMLDSDIIAPPDSINVLLHDIASYNNTAMASFPWDQTNARARAKTLFNAFETTKTQAYAYKVGNGCNIVTMEAYHAIGGFNPRLNVHEDGEFCYRLRRHGYNIICDFTREGVHLKHVAAPARFYLKFAWNSSNTYIEMLKLKSGMHILKVILSLALIVSFIFLFVSPDFLSIGLLIVSLSFAFWVNTSRRVLDDGIKVKPKYFLFVAPVLTALTILVVLMAIYRVAWRSVSSNLGARQKVKDSIG
ncbi:MAG: glycosyltransferase [Nitrososphaerota archaeon]|nr:glycosyltransferase [Nitrososphaerota archaeon]